MADRYKPVKDKTYKENQILLGIIGALIILFIVSSVLWMIFDYGWMIGTAFLCISGIIFDLLIINKRRKKGIYLITEEEYQQIEADRERKKQPKRLK